MRLEAITRVIQPINVRGSLEHDIQGIAYDSRTVREGFLFVALQGARDDGRRYIEDAIRRGAVAIVSEENDWTRRDVAHLHVENARLALAEISCAFYNHPSSRIDVVGVTGTNGKTSVAYMTRAILEAAGRRCGLIGTIQYQIGERIIPAVRTTPEAPDIQFMLDQMIRAGSRCAVMEVSSHALHQQRVWGTDFSVGIFTNLTRDHLDYHGDMDSYFAAKSMLFRNLGMMGREAVAVINVDDPWGMQLAQVPGLHARLVTCGTHPSAAFRAEDISVSMNGTRFRMITGSGEHAVKLPLLGRFNVDNALAAVAAAGALGVAPDAAAKALAAMEPIRGRLEHVPGRAGGPMVFVDYAHTDDALSSALRTLRALGPRRLIVVFGCGGDRDRSKRPVMGAAAMEFADLAIVTSDNPRTEDPEAIIREITAGMHPAERYETAVDREKAIARAIGAAGSGDIVLVAGKGHETYQEFGKTVIPFDDREVVRRYLR